MRTSMYLTMAVSVRQIEFTQGRNAIVIDYPCRVQQHWNTVPPEPDTRI